MYNCKIYVNRPRVNNPEAIQKVLLEHWCTVQFWVSLKDPAVPILRARYRGQARLPQAVRLEKIDTDFPELAFLVAEVLRRHGDQGFIELLLALAPYLETPLTIQVVCWSRKGKPITAQEWYVAPGATEIEINRFRHSELDPDQVKVNYMVSGTGEVDDREAVERIIANYHCNFTVRLRSIPGASGAWLSLRGKSWPVAVSLDKYGLRDSPIEVRNASLLLDHLKAGGQGFMEFLQALGPHLKTSLGVVSFWDPPPLLTVMHWDVRPGTAEVKTKRYW